MMSHSDTVALATQVHFGGEKKQRILRGRIEAHTQETPAGYQCVMMFDELDHAVYVAAGGYLEMEVMP